MPVVSQISLWGRNLPSTVYAYYSFSGNCAKSVLQNWYDQVFDLEAEDQYELFENLGTDLRKSGYGQYLLQILNEPSMPR